MSNIEIFNERVDRDTGIKVLNDALAAVEEYVDPAPYRGVVHTFGGTKKILAFKFKCEVPDLEFADSDDDNSPVGDYNAPPFLTAGLNSDTVYCSINGRSWFPCSSEIVRVGNDDNDDSGPKTPINPNRWPGASRTSGARRGNELAGTYITYDYGLKHESIINILTVLRFIGVNVDDQLRAVIFDGMNRRFGVNIESVELAGVDDVVDRCLETLNCDDKRLVSRHVLLAGPPGCGKSEIIKRIIQLTPEWVHCPFDNDTHDLQEFMKNLDKIMKFLNRRVMIIVDEIDEIGLTRDKGQNRVYDLLRVMDGVSDIGHIKFVATTNRPADLDPALLRIGRFGPVEFLDAPDDATYGKIVQFYADRYDARPKSLNIGKIVKARDGSVGSDVRAAFEDCIVHNEEITTENVLKNLMRILDVKKKERNNYL